MINNSTQPSKLDEAVKNALNNYEASNAQPDWSKMENMLDSVPKGGSFQWSTSLKVIVGLAVVAGGYFVYSGLKSNSSTSTTSVPVVNTPVETHSVTPTPIVTPTVAKNIVVTPSVQPEENTSASLSVTKEEVKKEEVVVAKEEKKKDTSLSETAVVDKKDKKKNKKDKDKKESETPVDTKVIGMGNEPVFGDMLDSSKGIIGETKEKESTKKAAVSKKNTPVGWDNFMFKNVDPDSLRKYREKKDSTKVQ